MKLKIALIAPSLLIARCLLAAYMREGEIKRDKEINKRKPAGPRNCPTC